MNPEQSPCATCAFRPGCETFEDEPDNRLASEIAAMSGIPFYCHDKDPNWRTQKRTGLTRAEHRQLVQTMPICAGWKSRVAELNRKGVFTKATRQIRRYLGQRALELLREFKACSFEVDKADILAELERIMIMLTKRRKRNLSNS
jgi:hypothetical protein